MLDRLCGLYALVHFLRDLRDHESKFIFGTYSEGEDALRAPEPQDRSEDAFWYVLDAAERLNMLSADYILRGYPAGHLVGVFNLLRDELGLDYSAVHFSDLAKLGKKHSFRSIAESVFADPRANAVIAQWDNHYYLSRGFAKNSLAVEDSTSDGRPRKELKSPVLNEMRLSYSLAILENSSAIFRTLQDEIW